MPPTSPPSPPTTWRPSGRLARLSADRAALFVYGTLLFPDVQRALLGRVPRSTSTTASGWRVAALRGRSYPGLVPGNSAVTGLVLLDLNPDDWRIVDAFEDDIYDLQRIRLDDGNAAWTYACADHDVVLPDNWDIPQFASRELPAYARRCAGWRNELALQPGDCPA